MALFWICPSLRSLKHLDNRKTDIIPLWSLCEAPAKRLAPAAGLLGRRQEVQRVPCRNPSRRRFSPPASAALSGQALAEPTDGMPSTGCLLSGKFVEQPARGVMPCAIKYERPASSRPFGRED